MKMTGFKMTVCDIKHINAYANHWVEFTTTSQSQHFINQEIPKERSNRLSTLRTSCLNRASSTSERKPQHTHLTATCLVPIWALWICDPLQQNQEQVLFLINWVIGFIRKYRLLAIIWHKNHDSIYHISGDMTFCDPNHSIILQKFNVRKWWLKFTFYIDINAEKSWEFIIWCTKQ